MAYIDGKEILFSPNINIGEGGGGVMEYNETIIFKKGDIVSYNGLLYTPKADNTSGILPTNEIAWEELTSGKANKFEVAELRGHVDATVQTFDEYTFANDVKINNLEQKSIITNKRLANLESATLDFIEDSTVAYQKTVPENALPYAKVQKIGGMTYKDGDILRSAPVTELVSEGVNLMPYPYYETTKTYNGITFTDNGDGTITANGTATSDSSFNLARNFPVKTGMVLSGTHNGGSDTYEIQGYLDSNNFISTNKGYEVAKKDFTVTLRIVIRSGYTANNLVFKPMMSYNATLPYHPYFKHTFSIPEAVQTLEGYGQGNPDNADEYNYIDYDKKIFYQFGNIVNNAWVTNQKEIDLSAILIGDNYIEVEGSGTITAVNDYNYAVPTTIDYVTDIGE